MNARTIRRDLYKVLRKTGVPRERIAEDASFYYDMMMDDVDMTCFLFYLETKFDLEIDSDSLNKIKSVQSTLNYLEKECV